VPVENIILLPDGRKLAYFDLGDPAGHPVIHAHGAPSGKLETAFFDLHAIAQRVGIRLLALDRPGVGGSDPVPGRTLLSWADDVAAFAHSLKLGRFALFGYSIGAGSTLACLHRLRDRLTAAAIVSGAGPAQVPGLADGRAKDVARVLHFARHYPRITGQILRFMKWGTKSPEKMIAASGRGMPAADRAIADRPSAAAPFAAFIADAMRNGTDGVRDDMRLVASPWGFEPEQSDVPVMIWHGDADTNVPVAAATWLAARLPNASLTLVPGGGHISVLDSHAEAIFVQLRDRAAA
jgi:Predicted hydrolases or acyltransferases (alpha/beta hydrolase superfamily)